MIVSRAPVRFSLGGGGTDLPGYASKRGGFVVSAAIDKYVYVCVNQRFYRDIRVAYSKTEIAPDVDHIEHPIVREALRLVGPRDAVEIVSVADVPANSGLGSSSSFTVALLQGLHAFRGHIASPRELAEQACEIEMVRLREPVGRQDQYISAFGGVTALHFEPDGTTRVEPVPASRDVIAQLASNLLIVYSGIERPARWVLGEQSARLAELDDEVLARMDHIKALGHEVYRLLVRGQIDGYGELLHEHWQRKRLLTSNMTDEVIDEHYAAARRAGAIGGKLMGAGGGGFFMFYVRPGDRARVATAMKQRGLQLLETSFDFEGARLVTGVAPSRAT